MTIWSNTPETEKKMWDVITETGVKKISREENGNKEELYHRWVWKILFHWWKTYHCFSQRIPCVSLCTIHLIAIEVFTPINIVVASNWDENPQAAVLTIRQLLLPSFFSVISCVYWIKQTNQFSFGGKVKCLPRKPANHWIQICKCTCTVWMTKPLTRSFTLKNRVNSRSLSKTEKLK